MTSVNRWCVATLTSVALAATALAAPATAAQAPGPPAPAVGAQTVGDSLFPHQGNGGYEVGHYDLDLAFDDATGAIAATATLRARTLRAPLRRFSLDLEGLTVDGVDVGGAPASFTREDAGDKHKLVVTPAEPVDGRFVVVVRYHGVPVSHTDADGSSEGWNRTSDGAIALNEPIGVMTFLPSNNTPTDKARFAVDLTVRSGLQAVSNGVLDDRAPTGEGLTTWSWRQPQPQAPYLLLVAIGRFERAHREVRLLQGRRVPEWSFRDPGAEDPTVLRRQIGPILRALARHYGPYQGRATGVITDVVPSGVNYALETQSRPFFPGGVDRLTLVHELSHEWFGDAVSPTDWSDVWLNEGPATYLEIRLTHELYDGPAPVNYFRSRWRNATSDSPAWRLPASGFSDPADLFGPQVYTRGGTVLAALSTRVGEVTVDRILRTWFRERRGSDGTTAEFERLASRVAGRDLTAFFRTWVHRVGRPAAWPRRVPPR